LTLPRAETDPETPGTVWNENPGRAGLVMVCDLVGSPAVNEAAVDQLILGRISACGRTLSAFA